MLHCSPRSSGPSPPVISPRSADPYADYANFIVGESRASLICPFRSKHARTAVKGQLCSHLQCFDYENFMEMNSRKPSWRCPFVTSLLASLTYKLIKKCSRSIDDALSFNDVPVTACGLPSLLKQVYHRRNDASFQLQSAITILMLSIKKACKNGWFHSTESDGLLSMANELCSSFCMRANTIADMSGVLSIISNIIIPSSKQARTAVKGQL